jgi:hypothetical protein
MKHEYRNPKSETNSNNQNTKSKTRQKDRRRMADRYLDSRFHGNDKENPEINFGAKQEENGVQSTPDNLT